MWYDQVQHIRWIHRAQKRLHRRGCPNMQPMRWKKSERNWKCSRTLAMDRYVFEYFFLYSLLYKILTLAFDRYVRNILVFNRLTELEFKLLRNYFLMKNVAIQGSAYFSEFSRYLVNFCECLRFVKTNVKSRIFVKIVKTNFVSFPDFPEKFSRK